MQKQNEKTTKESQHVDFQSGLEADLADDSITLLLMEWRGERATASDDKY
jgi:hypothetical protein